MAKFPFPAEFLFNMHEANYAVSPDGQRFLINHAEETDSPITVVVNGLSALEK